MLTEHEKRWVITLWELDWTYAEIAANIVRKRYADELTALTEEIGELCKSEKERKEVRENEPI